VQLTVFQFPLYDFSISPGALAFAVHLTVFPFPLLDFSISTGALAFAVQLTVFEFPLFDVSFSIGAFASSFRLTVLHLAEILPSVAKVTAFKVLIVFLGIGVNDFRAPVNGKLVLAVNGNLGLGDCFLDIEQILGDDHNALASSLGLFLHVLEEFLVDAGIDRDSKGWCAAVDEDKAALIMGLLW